MTNNQPLQLSSNVNWVGVNDTETPLFEGLWRIPEGVSYNSYLIVGSEKTALIDSVHEKNALEHFEKISKLTDFLNIDYLVINHMEPDHTGAVSALLTKASNARVVFTPIAQTIFKKFYGFDPAAVIVKDEAAEISLGNKTLRFIQTPWLHWPETMSTYLVEDRMLFCCDAFGSFKKLPADAILESDIDMVKQNICGCSQKYFATVFNGQREWILKAIEKFYKMNLEIEVLAPSHGPVYTDNAKQTISKWASWSKGTYTKTVVVAYDTMYGMTAKCLDAIVKGVREVGGTVLSFNLSEDTAVDALTALVEAPALIVGSPTYEHEIFPKVVDFLNLLKTKKFSNRCASVFGSFGWSGEATRKLSVELTTLGFELVEKPLSVFGSPTKEDLERASQLGKAVAEKAFSKYGAV
ncbi:MAG: FprA family A-type flavoprotein [Candidatus Bathyarchaeia archaeon]